MVHLKSNLHKLMKYLHLIDWWPPFPESEYSGLLAVIGKDNNEVHNLLLQWRDDYLEKYDSLIMEKVVNARTFALVDEETSRVVEAFTT